MKNIKEYIFDFLKEQENTEPVYRGCTNPGQCFCPGNCREVIGHRDKKTGKITYIKHPNKRFIS